MMPISMRLSWMMFPTMPQQSRAVLVRCPSGHDAKDWVAFSWRIAIAYPSKRVGGVWCIDVVFGRHALIARSCCGSGVDGPRMLPAGRCIGVQADAEGWRGAIARRTRAGIDQAADERGFPAFARAVFHSPEEAVRGEVRYRGGSALWRQRRRNRPGNRGVSAARRRLRQSGQTRALCRSAPGSR